MSINLRIDASSSTTSSQNLTTAGQAARPTTPSLSNIPTEVLSKILSFLPYTSNLPLTSRKFQALTKESKLHAFDDFIKRQPSVMRAKEAQIGRLEKPLRYRRLGETEADLHKKSSDIKTKRDRLRGELQQDALLFPLNKELYKRELQSYQHQTARATSVRLRNLEDPKGHAPFSLASTLLTENDHVEDSK